MTSSPHTLELLAPARDADIGIEAIRHGADAVYIGGPAFGARTGADNTLRDIARLVQFAHRFHARVFVTLNTILHDHELDPARALIWQLYDAGIDALIIQDMGLLELDLPPLQLHASTQTDIRDVAKAKFLQDVGFSQIVLAREMPIEQIRDVAAATHCTLEYFIHGALCVAFSGQCYISHAHTGRSANRGECSQACRLPYTLTDAQGRMLAHDQHLLSMKDNDQTANLRLLAEAGIRSFKIEGRLKDMSYVKNITAHYRTCLDALIDESSRWQRASSGRSTYTFTPRPEKTYNRGTTDYFAHGRQHGIEAFTSPAFMGEAIGRVHRIRDDHIEIDSEVKLNNGDGLSWFDSRKEQAGIRISRVDGKRLYPNTMPADLPRGTTLYRNRDQQFERLLERPSADRRVGVWIDIAQTEDGIVMRMADEDGIHVTHTLAGPFELATHPDRATQQIRDQLAKLGATMFAVHEVRVALTAPPHLAASQLNALRRETVEALETARVQAHPRLQREHPIDPPARYPERELSYLGNVLNARARDFYARHGVSLIEAAYETNQHPDDASLMITKHCLRFSFHLCPKEAKGVIGVHGTIKAEPMTLKHGTDVLRLEFDCKRCEMHVIGRLRKPVMSAQPITFMPKPAKQAMASP